MVFTLTTDMILVRYFSLSEENIFYLSEFTKQNLVWSSNNLGQHIWWMANFEPSPKKFSNCICRFIYRFNNFFFQIHAQSRKVLLKFRLYHSEEGCAMSLAQYFLRKNMKYSQILLSYLLSCLSIFILHSSLACICLHTSLLFIYNVTCAAATAYFSYSTCSFCFQLAEFS